MVIATGGHHFSSRLKHTFESEVGLTNSQGGCAITPSILEERKELFKDLKFGMFVHWSLFSLPGGHRNWATPPEAIHRFRAEKFDPDSLVELAQRSGARYMTFMTKHHDGFCLFSTELTDFNSTQSPSGEDFVALLADSCRAKGMNLFLYYSLADLHHPGFVKRGEDWRSYVDYYQGQIRELCSNYGEVAGFWLDPGPWHGRDYNYAVSETYDLIHDLQPHALVMGRDFFEFEKKVPELPGQMSMTDDFGEAKPFPVGPPSPSNPPFEVCETVNDSWNYNPSDLNFKSPETLIRKLVRIVGAGGNLLLNLAPDGSGAIPAEQEAIFRRIGDWLERNAASIYSTRPVACTPWGYIVSSPHCLYMHVISHGGGIIEISGLNKKVCSARRGDEELDVRRQGQRVLIKLPPRLVDPLDTVIRLDVDETKLGHS